MRGGGGGNVVVLARPMAGVAVKVVVATVEEDWQVVDLWQRPLESAALQRTPHGCQIWAALSDTRTRLLQSLMDPDGRDTSCSPLVHVVQLGVGEVLSHPASSRM